MAQTGQTPRRQFGKTEVQLSALGLGGHHPGDAEDLNTAKQIVNKAFDGGVNCFDNCWEYHRGKSEVWMDECLKDKRSLSAASAHSQTGGSMTAANGTVPRRRLGKTDIEVAILGIGGYHIGSAESQDAAKDIVRHALDAGLNFFDNAWEYHQGQSEEWLGAALGDRRNEAVLMTKVCTHGRDKKVAMQMLEESLRRLRTDHLDVWQIHEVIYDNDPDMIFAPNGAAEALLQAKKDGKVRLVGFTGHKDPAIHLKMLSHGFPFDTVQMPLNPSSSPLSVETAPSRSRLGKLLKTRERFLSHDCKGVLVTNLG